MENLEDLWLLKRYRREEYICSDYEWLETQVDSQPTVESLRQAPWNKVSFFFYQNNGFLIFLLGHIFWYFGMRCAPMVCVTHNSCKRNPLKILCSSEEGQNYPIAR